MTVWNALCVPLALGSWNATEGIPYRVLVAIA